MEIQIEFAFLMLATFLFYHCRNNRGELNKFKNEYRAHPIPLARYGLNWRAFLSLD